MAKKLIALMTFVAVIGAGYFLTRPTGDAEGPEKDEAYYQNVLKDMRAMMPEGENGEWSDQQLIWLTLVCQDFAELLSSSEGVIDGHFEIMEICGSVEQQAEAAQAPPT